MAHAQLGGFGAAPVAEGDWIVYRAPASSREPGRLAQLGRPGLWRRLASRGVPVDEFSAPAFLLSHAGEHAAERTSDLAAWAGATYAREVPRDWMPPPVGELRAALGVLDRSIAAGDRLLRIDLQRETAGLRLRCAITPDLGARSATLQSVLLALEDASRLVRFGRGDDGWFYAEVDLTGVPHWACTSLAALATRALSSSAGEAARIAHFISRADNDVLDFLLPRV